MSQGVRSYERFDGWPHDRAGGDPADAMTGAAGGWSGWSPSAVLDHERPRWILWLPVIFGLGAACYFQADWEISLAMPLCVVTASVAMAWGAGNRMSTAVCVCVLCMGLFAAGIVSAKLRTLAVSAPVLAQQMDEARLTGFLELIEPRPEKGARLTVRVRELGGLQAHELPRRVRVTSRASPAGLAPGDLIEARVRVGPPPPPSLPGDYDFPRYAFLKGIGGIGFTLSAPVRSPDSAERPFDLDLQAQLAILRRAIGARIISVLPGETGAIANALLTGERGAISDQTNEAFRQSGLYHVLSISGLHMAIMGGAVFFAVRFALALIPALALRFPIHKWAALAALAGSLCYLAISGGAFATIRSFLMISVMFIAILFDRPAIALRNVAIAAIVILAIFPESIIDPGFQMSFAAVIALVVGYRAYEAGTKNVWWLSRRAGTIGLVPRALTATIVSTLLASIAVAPLALYHFNQTQFYAVLANATAMPVINLVIMPMALATLIMMPLGAEELPLRAMGAGIDMMTACAQWVAGLPGASGVFSAISPEAFIACVAGFLMLTLCEHPVRFAGPAIVVLGLALAPSPEPPSLLVGPGNKSVAVRGSDGRLNIITDRSGRYTVERWLQRDGDARTFAAIRSRQGYTCDEVGCSARLPGGRILTVTDHPRALPDDCRLSDIIVVRYTGTAQCAGGGFQDGGTQRRASPASLPQLIITPADTLREGTHVLTTGSGKPSWLASVAGALFASKTSGADKIGQLPQTEDATPADRNARSTGTARARFRLTTVAQARGSRPWAQPKQNSLNSTQSR